MLGKKITATHAQEKQTKKQQKRNKKVQMVSLVVGNIHSEARGGRGDEEDEERGSCRAQWVITMGQSVLSIITPCEVCLCSVAAKEELFTA